MFFSSVVCVLYFPVVFVEFVLLVCLLVQCLFIFFLFFLFFFHEVEIFTDGVCAFDENVATTCEEYTFFVYRFPGAWEEKE